MFAAGDSLAVRWARISSWALMAAWLMRMSLQIIAFRDPFVPLRDDISLLLFQTAWGTTWIIQGVVVIGIAGVLRWGVPRESGDGLSRPMKITPVISTLPVLVLSLILTLSMSGHAMGAGSWRWAAVMADAIHTLSAGVWIGSLVVILGVSREGLNGSARATSAFLAQIQIFSPIALVSGGAVVSMGIALSWTHLTMISDLWTTRYGLILSAKVIFVILILGLGFLNWRTGTAGSGPKAVMRTIRQRGSWEVSLAAGVILLTAILVHSTKP